jgi:hypothetical protein
MEDTQIIELFWARRESAIQTTVFCSCVAIGLEIQLRPFPIRLELPQTSWLENCTVCAKI